MFDNLGPNNCWSTQTTFGETNLKEAVLKSSLKAVNK